MQSPNKIDEAFQIIESENETPIFAHDCRVIKNSLIKKKKLIILTERSLYYFSKKMSKKKYNFFKLNSISIDKKKIALGFGKDMTIKIALSKNWGESKANFIDSLFYIIQHLLTNSGINRIQLNIDTSNISNSSSKYKLTNLHLASIPSYYGAFSHFESSIRDDFFSFDMQSINLSDQYRIRFSILFHRQIFEISSFLNPERSSKLLFDMLPLLPSARYLRIKHFGDTNVYQFLNNYVDDITSIQNIRIDGNVNEQNDTFSFDDFLNKMKIQLNSKMVGLSFSNSKFTENHLNSISQYVLARNIQALEFRRSFLNPTVTNFFITTFLPSISNCFNFTSLYLEKIESLDFTLLSHHIPAQVKSLAVVNCDIPINQVFNTIKMNSNFSNNLNVLNLSLNKFDTYQESFIKDVTFSIPTFLTVIILDYVSFPYGILVPFLNSLFRSICDGCELSLVQMNASTDDLDQLDAMFHGLVRDFTEKSDNVKSLRTLKWDFNPISAGFIKFLGLQTSLMTLSVRGCFSPDDAKSFGDFCEYIASSNSLTKLVCRRFGKLSLQDLTPVLLNAVSRSKIAYLDISGSKCGPGCYAILKRLISGNGNNGSNRIQPLRCLVYDRLCLSKKAKIRDLSAFKEKLLDFIEFSNRDEFSCKCSFPIHDVENLYRNGVLRLDEIAAVISRCNIKAADDYVKPLTVFFKENEANYPFYFKEFNSDIRVVSQPQTEADSNISLNSPGGYGQSASGSPNNSSSSFVFSRFDDGNAFETCDSSLKVGELFGDNFAKFNAQEAGDRRVFSFHSDDEGFEGKEIGQNASPASDSLGPTNRSIFNAGKHPNTGHSFSKDNSSNNNNNEDKNKNNNDNDNNNNNNNNDINDDDFSLIIEEEEEDDGNFAPQGNSGGGNNAGSIAKLSQSLPSSNKMRSYNEDEDDDDDDDGGYSYDYYSQEDRKVAARPAPVKPAPVKPKVASPIRRGPVRPFNPMLNRRPFKPIQINTAKKPAVQLNLHDSSDYYSYSYDYSDNDSNKAQKKPSDSSNNNNKAQKKLDDDDDSYSGGPEGSSKSSGGGGGVGRAKNAAPQRRSPQRSPLGRGPAASAQALSASTSQGRPRQARRAAEEEGARVEDLPPLLTGGIGGADEELPRVGMSPTRDFDELKQLKTDSYSSEYGSDSY